MMNRKVPCGRTSKKIEP